MFGECGCGPHRHGRGRFIEAALRHLPWFAGARSFLDGIDLSDEQIEKIADLKHESFAKMAHARVDKMEMMHTIIKELAKPKIDRALIEELKGKIKETKTSMVDLMVDNMVAFAEILTPEQRKKIRIKRIRDFLMPDEDEHGCEHPHDHPHHHHEPPPPPPPPRHHRD